MEQTQSPENLVALSPRVPSRAYFQTALGCFQIYTLKQVDDDYASEELVYESSAYSGAPGHVNKPGDVALVGLGPIPPGDWHVGLPHNHGKLGPLCFRLRPGVNTDVHRRSEFFIHGDNRDLNQSASSGCIILSRTGRAAMVEYRVRHLTVT